MSDAYSQNKAELVAAAERMNERTKRPTLVVNGRTAVGYRVDRLDTEAVGIEFLRHPFAIVPKLEDAQQIVALFARVDALEKACKAAKNALSADIPSHPMRDKCFAVIHAASKILSSALAQPGATQ